MDIIISIKKNKIKALAELVKEKFTLSESLYELLEREKISRTLHCILVGFFFFYSDIRTLIPMAMSTRMRVTQYLFFCVLYHSSFTHPFILFYHAYSKTSAHTNKSVLTTV